MKGFLAGLATGLAVSYLTAPRSGKETRQQLTDMAGKQTDGLKEQWNKTVSSANQLATDLKSQLGGNKNTPDVYETNPPATTGEETYQPATPAQQSVNDLPDYSLAADYSLGQENTDPTGINNRGDI